MGQPGFFDADKRLAALSKKGDPLEAIAALVPWESFRADIEAVVLTPEAEKKSSAGRKPFDAVLMFRMLILQSLYNLSDEQIEYQVRDRMSFTRFLGLEFEDDIPDGTTLWLFREKLAQAGLVKTLFDRFDRHLQAQGYIARGGQMVDATIVPVAKQRNSNEENESVKRGETPAEWEQKPAKDRQKDTDARWTKKHGKSFFGYKNHVNADKTHKLIRDYAVTDAAVHDSRVLDELLDKTNTGKDVFGDSAYRSIEIEEKLAARGFRSRICGRGARGHPLSAAAQAANRAKSRIRARIEHVFGAQETAPGGRLVRTIGIVRARAKIGLQNLVYNIRRLATLERMAAA
ncbi:MAG TPA: IS5 family transposase [Terriglobales bacterium]|nr:IS5 family transposase [Terriglobales bacterium]